MLVKPDNCPDILYKYRSFDQNNYTFDILKNGNVYFSSAKKFNDPFDSSLPYNFEGLHGKKAELWLKDAIDRHFSDLGGNERNLFFKNILKEIRDPKSNEDFLKKQIELQYNKFGIYSLSEINKDILMWSHYSEDHKGVCIGLNTKILFKKFQEKAKQGKLFDILKVYYYNKIPKVNFFDSMLKKENPYEDIYKLIGTKSIHWNYEKEYRLILWDNVNCTISFGPELISDIIIGCKADKSNIEKIKNICDNYKHNVNLYQARKSKNIFKLILDKI